MSVELKSVLNSDASSRHTHDEGNRIDGSVNSHRVKMILNVVGEQTLSLEEIANKTNISKPTVNECVTSLRRDGLVKLHTHTDVDGNSEKVITSVQKTQQKKRLKTNTI